MGAEQPKKVAKVTKAQIDVGTLKARIHLQLIRDRKNNQIIKGQKELIAKIKSKSRNKTEEVLISERVVNGLKYAQACNLLIGYAATLRGQAHFIADNMMNPQKMEPWLTMIYSLIFAADHMGLSSLNEFKTLMRALNDPVAVQKYVNPEILNALAPNPSAEEINVYMLEFSERNEISLEQINMIGHKVTKEWKNIPSVPPTPNNDTFSDLEKRMAEEKNPYGGGGFNPNNPNNQGYNPNNQGYNPNNQGYNPSNQGYNPNNQGFNPNNQGYNPNQQIGSNNPYQKINPNDLFNLNNGGNIPVNTPNINQNPQIPANLGPNFYVPGEVAPQKPAVITPSRSSINSINDIDYYPEIDSQGPMFNKGGYSDPSFDQICERLKKGL